MDKRIPTTILAAALLSASCLTLPQPEPREERTAPAQDSSFVEKGKSTPPDTARIEPPADTVSVPETPPDTTKRSAPEPPPVEEMEQELMHIPSGNYSGIAYIGQNADSTYRFAVVDDKSPGGGLFWLDIAIAADGTIDGTTARITPLPGTKEGTKRPDNEDVVFDGATFWVASEGDQHIRQYDMNGRPTGDEMDVPEEMSTEHIHKNRGFEALAYDAGRRLFWAATEMPLIDEPDTMRHALQSFTADGRPDKRYCYRRDTPKVTATESDIYVHGISGMTVLPSGKLIIMEREVHVPETFADGHSWTKLYEITGLDHASGTLAKKLLLEFDTGLDGLLPILANYEGICVGPTLGGRQTLVLISDSQGGMESIVGFRVPMDFIKIIFVNN